MNCFIHPNESGVAQCKRCNRALCKKCSDRCVNSDDKYVGLCSDCVLAVGINCDYHPSRQAVVRCDVCGKFLCGDCSDIAGAVGNIGTMVSESKHCCHTCVSEAVEHNITVDMWYARHITKKGMIWVGILSAIGLIIGLVSQISGGKGAEEILVWAWLGIGIGGAARVLFLLPRYVFVDSLKASFGRSHMENLYVMERLKRWFVRGFLGGLLGGLIVCFIGAITGPIVPLIYMLVRRGQFRKAGLMIERNSIFCATLRNAHTKSSDPALRTEIRQGADIFVADMEATERILKPVLWFWA